MTSPNMNSVMRTSIVCAISSLAVLASVSTSMARPDARKMTCHQTQSLIKQEGAVVITTGTHTYARFVASNRYCFYPEVRRPTYISTKDANQCPVSHCERPIKLFDD
ncbi:MAG: hypothetical protein JJ969_17410 [Rhizobiaceae bacterium]|nr:hypothetical protein [Rhizobiaceae bacterium]